MYVPEHARETDPERLLEFVEQNPFAMVVSRLGGETVAAHLPLLLDRTAGDQGTLRGHFARADPHWRAEDPRVLAVFHGPHAYISPAWYEEAAAVPTWNYVAVHIAGTLHVDDDPAETVRWLRKFVTHFEAGRPVPWSLPADPEFTERLARGVVGFRIEIESLTGQWKLNRHHSPARREKTVAALRMQPDEGSRAIAEWMAAVLPPRAEPTS